MKLRRDIVALLVLGALAAAGPTLASGASYTATTANPAQVFTGAADWVAPAVTAAVPAGNLRATVTLTATVTDASAIASVRLQRSPAGAATWTDVCTDTVAPYSCAFDTTAVADGHYDVRAIAVDAFANSGMSAVVAGRLVDNTGPAVELADPASNVRASVTLSATADDGTGAGVASVRIERSPQDAGSWTAICTDAVAPYACTLDTTTLANGIFDLRAVATDAAGNTATSALQTVGVDNAAPTVTLTDPGTPLSGTITLATTPADADSGVDTVTIQRAAAGGSSWTDVCVIAAAPWTCRFATSGVADGLYDLRAVAVDEAGNTKTSATVASRRVDNTASSISLEDPGSPLRGTITLAATASSTGGVASVLIQRSPAGKATWTDICTDTTSPYSCTLNTATAATPDGAYDLRAIMTTTAGAKLTSATVAARTIDNTAVHGTDVQAVNKSGGTLGRMGTGDTITLTYSEAMKASTLVFGWSGSGAANLYVRLTDASQVETTRFALDSGGYFATGLGTITSGGDFARTNTTVVFAATATLSSAAGGGSTVTITLGALTSGSSNLSTQSSATTLRWTPSATATDLAGNPATTALVTESGTSDRDY